jgi:hypothetical protein
MLLAHQLSHLTLGHARVDSRFSFADVLRVPDSELLDLLRFDYTPEQEAAADEMTVDFLTNSAYREEMAEAGLFMRAIEAHADGLDHLLTAQLGEHLADHTEVVRRSRILRDTRSGRTAALPLGSRLTVDSWTGRVSLFQAETSGDGTRHGTAPLSVGPLMPFVRYVHEPAASAAEQVPQTTGSPLGRRP